MPITKDRSICLNAVAQASVPVTPKAKTSVDDHRIVGRFQNAYLTSQTAHAFKIFIRTLNPISAGSINLSGFMPMPLTATGRSAGLVVLLLSRQPA